MALRRLHQHRWWSDIAHRVDVNLRETSPYLCRGDREIACHALTLWGCAVCDILSKPRCCEEVGAWLIQLTGRLPLTRIATILKTVAGVVRDFVPYLEPYTNVRSWRSFKRCVALDKGEMNMVMGLMVPKLVSFLEVHDALTCGQLLTFLEFWSRIPIGSRGLQEECAQSYLEFEQSYPAANTSSQDALDLRHIMTKILQTCPLYGTPKHSNGATAEVKRSSGLVAKEHALVCGLHSRHQYASKLLGVDVPATGRRVSSRWVAVPKNVLKARSIAAEPTLAQYLQQSLLARLAHWLPRSAFHITMEDQSVNQRLAQEGSRTHRFGTIDLSNASDSVSYELAKFLLLPTRVGRLILATRVDSMNVRSKTIELKKFASMGSAVCFPVESMIFKAIVLLAEERMGVHHPSAVYGDDIVCHESCFYEVVRLLGSFGFSVNQDKTFSPYHPFKESCGGEYLHGQPVTVVRLPRKFAGRPVMGWVRSSGGRPSSIPSYVSVINEFYQYGLMTARFFSLHCLRSLKLAIPYGTDQSSGCILTSGPVRNDHICQDAVKKEAWQCDVRKVWRIVTREDRPLDDDPLVVRAWLRAAEQRSRTRVLFPEDALQVKLYPYATRGNTGSVIFSHCEAITSDVEERTIG